MSSIYGLYNLDGRPISKKSWNRIQEVTSWWKPDKAYAFLENNIGLAYLRLDVSSKDDEDIDDNNIHTEAEYTICADARLDNRNDLLNKLNIANTSTPDSLLILKAYIKYADECVHHLLGAFAFVIWDKHKKEIFAARDHIGIKPFNYYFKDNQFLFGSQRKSILAADNIDKYVDWEFIVQKYSKSMAVGNRTENLHIKKLLPAHILRISKKKLITKRYWNLDIHNTIKYSNEKDYLEHFLELFKEAIRVRMRGASRVSSHLSGGLDSSGISGTAAPIAKKIGKEFHVFSYVFPNVENLKTPNGIFNFNHLVKQQVDFSEIDFHHFLDKPIFRKSIEHLEHESLVCDGISWSNNVSTEYEIQHKAKENNIGILLSGFLGDEIITSFCRPYYLEYLERGQYVNFFRSNHQGESQPLKFLFLFFLKQASSLGIPINGDRLVRYFQSNRLGKSNPNFIGSKHLFNSDYVNSSSDLQQNLVYEWKSQIHERIPLSLKEYQRNHINRNWTSRRIESESLSALNFKMEYRYPMSDIRLLQYVLSLPVEQKRNKQQNRLLFRRAMKDIVIDEIRLGKKYSSFLKPMAHFYKSKGDLSLVNFWLKSKKNKAIFILDKNKVEDNLKYQRELGKLYKYFMLLDLFMKDKITF